MFDKESIVDAANLIQMLSPKEKAIQYKIFVEKFKAMPHFDEKEFRRMCGIDDSHCPVCGMILTNTEIKTGKCLSCRNHLKE
jgi:hypothetical protein